MLYYNICIGTWYGVPIVNLGARYPEFQSSKIRTPPNVYTIHVCCKLVGQGVNFLYIYIRIIK